MGKTKSRSNRYRAILGIREADLSPELISELSEAEYAFWLLDMPSQHRSIDEVAEMCWDVGVELIGQQVVEEIGIPPSLEGVSIIKYNERIIRAGINDMLIFVCKELMPRARKFAILNIEYGESVEGRERAAKESLFLNFPPPIAKRLCEEHNKELIDICRRCEAIFHAPQELLHIQTVAIIMGLYLIDNHPLAQYREVLDHHIIDENSTIEDIGRLVLSIGIPVLKDHLASGLPIH